MEGVRGFRPRGEVAERDDAADGGQHLDAGFLERLGGLEADQVETCRLRRMSRRFPLRDRSGGIWQELVLEQIVEFGDGQKCLVLALISPADVAGIPEREPDERGVLFEAQPQRGGARNGLDEAFFMKNRDIQSGKARRFP